jgi:O-antigen/teichoic acid export membrane protein
MSIAANYLYNALYQLIVILIPFITVPYVSRVLGAEGIGINAYTSSIFQYFALFGSIGIGLYASRTVAYVRDDRRKLSKVFWSIFFLQLVLSTVSLILYLSFTIFFIEKYKLIQLIQGINLIAIAIDISWLFVGMEDFKKLVIRSVILRALGVIAIFIFVKNPGDLWKYISLSCIFGVLGQGIMWIYLYDIVDSSKISLKDIIVHLKPSLELFLPQIAIQIYLVLNKTMLGVLANKQEVGFYESSDKIIKMTLALLTATGGVMLPRVANSYAKGEYEKVDHYIYTTLNFVSYLAIPMIFGLIGISSKFVPWFFGEEFKKCVILIILISPIMIAISISNVLGFQYMIPTGKTKQFTISVCIGAVVNFALNLILIKRFYSVGAALATVAAEAAVTGTQIYLLRKQIKMFVLNRKLISYCLASFIMYIPVIATGYFLKTSPATTFIQIAVGIVVYVSASFLLKSDINSYIFKLVFNKVRKGLVKKEARV